MYNNYGNNGRRPSFRERVARYMTGRYGVDRFYHFLVAVCLVLIVVNIFVSSWVLTLIEIAVFAYSIFRVMSKNVYKRRRENEIFLKICKKLGSPFVMIRNRFRDRKTHVYRKCPSCKSTLRLPRDKGKHTVRCPRCDARFELKIR